MSSFPSKLIGLVGLSCTALCILAVVLPAIGIGALGLSLWTTEIAIAVAGAAVLIGVLMRRRAAVRACAPDRRCGCG